MGQIWPVLNITYISLWSLFCRPFSFIRDSSIARAFIHPRFTITSTWNVTEESDPVKYNYYYEFIELIADVSFRDNLQNFWKYQADETVKGIDLLELALTVHPSSVLQVIVSDNEHEVRSFI